MTHREVVLLVDDAPQSVGALVEELESAGYAVLVAPDGASALQRLDLVTPDAILLDALMPGIDGFETCRRIKAHGFPMVLNMPVFKQNIDLIGEMCEWAADLGIEYIEFANIQYYNWALLNRDELLPSLEQIRQAEATVNAWRAKLGKRMTLYFVVPDYFEGRPKACMNGWGAIHLTIAPDGVAMPCQESRVIPGLEFESVRERSLAWLWHESPLFRKYRGLDWLPEPCQSCSEKEKDFGGCRCQAMVIAGEAAATDPACSKSPHHGRMVELATTEASAQSPDYIYRRIGAAV